MVNMLEEIFIQFVLSPCFVAILYKVFTVSLLRLDDHNMV